jgi:hypothetical protein
MPETVPRRLMHHTIRPHARLFSGRWVPVSSGIARLGVDVLDRRSSTVLPVVEAMTTSYGAEEMKP